MADHVVLAEPGGPVDATVSPQPVEGVPRPGRFTLMAPGWVPPRHLVTQALELCFTTDGAVLMVSGDGVQWTFPGGTVEEGETVEQALVREVAEEACACGALRVSGKPARRRPVEPARSGQLPPEPLVGEG